MKHQKKIAGNIAPEHKLTTEEKLQKKGIEFTRIRLTKRNKRIGVFCPDLYGIFVIKNYCRACPRFLGASGNCYLCKKK